MIPVFRIDQIHRLTTDKQKRLQREKNRALARSLSSNVVNMENERTVNREFVIQLWVKKYKHILEYMDFNSVHRRAILPDSHLTEEDLDYMDHQELREVFGMKAYPRLYENDHSPNDGLYSEWEWVEDRSVIPSEWEDKGIRLWLGQDMIEVPMSESDTSIWGLRSIIPGEIDGSSGDLLFKGSDFVEVDGNTFEAKYRIWELK